MDPNDVNNLSDYDISQILGLNTNATKQDRLALQMKLSNALRQNESPKGQMAGGVYIPPDPVDKAMNMYDHMSSIINAKQQAQQGDELDTQRSAALMKFANLLFKKNQLPQTPQDGTVPDSSAGGGGADIQ